MNRQAAVLSAFLICTFCHVNAQPAVYPLHIGDRWQYNLIPMTARIDRDSLVFNGQRYSLIHYGFEWRERWERYSGSQVYWYNTDVGQEFLWYDFSPHYYGDTVSIIPHANGPTVITFTGTGTYEIFGGTRRWWSFWVDYIPGVIDEEELQYVTDSLGMTCVSTMWYTTSVVGAIINGKQYGTVDVPERRDGRVSEFRLDQNYPNPFNPRTEIGFQITDHGLVTLRIYDLLGREVATLINEVKQPGMYAVPWDGSGCASGVYFYRLSTGNFVQTRRFVLLR
jgi:hypothetical protein